MGSSRPSRATRTVWLANPTTVPLAGLARRLNDRSSTESAAVPIRPKVVFDRPLPLAEAAAKGKLVLANCRG
jgi:hypothetical protein